MQFPWRARVLIDLQALGHNVGIVRKLAPDSRILAVVKSDAYGHGLESVSSYLDSMVDGFAVATVCEGMRCRVVSPDKPVVVLSGMWDRRQMEQYSEYRLDPVVHSAFQADWLENYRGPVVNAWIKIDTGMNRFGMSGDQVCQVCERLRDNPSIGTLRLISHLASADTRDDCFTRQQIERFAIASRSFRGECSLANSAGIIGWPDASYDWVRPGILIYGVSPMAGEINPGFYQPVMKLQARVIAMRQVAAGESIGYGRAYTASRTIDVAIVSLGYGDGYPRVISEEAFVLIRGQKAPIVGRVAMDSIAVDISDLEVVCIQDVVTLWGDMLPVERVAGWADTIAYELLCKVTTRVPRVIIRA